MVRYEIVDVFTGRVFTGNPLAVVFDAEQLTAKQMQAIAAEFNLSETVFVLSPVSEEADYRVRIFTPSTELPYAGHPSVGVAVTLARHGEIPTGEVVQECGAGLLPVEVEGQFATLTGAQPTLGVELDPAPLLAATGLRADDLAGTPRAAGAGIEFPYLPVQTEAVARAVNRPAPETPTVYVFSYDQQRRFAHARLFATGLGVPEDPATGSAALGLGAYLAAAGWVPSDGVTTYVVQQGAEINRPSHLECTVDVADGAAVRARVRGQVLPVAKGELIALP